MTQCISRMSLTFKNKTKKHANKTEFKESKNIHWNSYLNGKQPALLPFPSWDIRVFFPRKAIYFFLFQRAIGTD